MNGDTTPSLCTIQLFLSYLRGKEIDLKLGDLVEEESDFEGLEDDEDETVFGPVVESTSTIKVNLGAVDDGK